MAAQQMYKRVLRNEVMGSKRPDLRPDPKLQAWIVARKRHHLSHAHVQMGRELGMNPAKLGGLDNHRQEPWKQPLLEFIEQVYEKRFGRAWPEVVITLEERARTVAAKEAARKADKKARRAAREAVAPSTASLKDPDGQ
jgi:hypothetical protein